MTRLIGLVGLLVCLASGALARDAAPLTYVVKTTGGAAADARLPMIVAVHGLGDRAESFARLFDRYPGKARIIVPRAPTPYGRGASWFTIERPPGPAMIADMRASTAALNALIQRAAKQHPTRGKPVITGFSQGGMLSFAVAVTHPEAIRAAVPIAGKLPEALWPTRGPIAPIVALHGTADRRIPYAAGEAIVLKLLDLGADARLVPFLDVGHRIPGPVRATLYETLARLTR